MLHEPWLIQYCAETYRFGRTGSDNTLTEMSPAEPADVEALMAAMVSAGYGGEPVMLAIPSTWCVSACVALASRRLARNRQAVAYALEEHLPLSAEEMVYDFVTHDTHAFGVAVDTAAIQPVVNSLEQAGIQVATVTPTAMLLLERLASMRRLPTDGVVLLADGDGCDFFLLTAARPRQWRSLPLDGKTVSREAAALFLARADDGAPAVVAVNLADDVAAALAGLGADVDVTRQECEQDEVILAAAADVLTRGKRPWIELRRGQLGEYDPYRLMRGSLHLLLASLLVAIVSLTAVGWTRANAYAQLAESVNAQKQEIFRQLFPNARVPTGIRSRLESEHRVLVGMSGRDAQTPQLQSVVGFLVDTLESLPTDLRFRLLEMRWEESVAYLEGEARSHGDADGIAAPLRSCGFTVDPPRSEKLSQENEAVSFSLNISVLPPASGHE